MIASFDFSYLLEMAASLRLTAGFSSFCMVPIVNFEIAILQSN